MEKIKAFLEQTGNTIKEFEKSAGVIRLPLWASYLLILLFTLITAAVCASLQPEGTKAVLESFAEQPLLIVLNTVPLLMSVLIIFAVSNNVFLAGGVSFSFWVLLSYVNRLKTELRSDPLIPQDFAQIKEGCYAVKDFNIDIQWRMIVVFILTGLILMGAGFFVRTVRTPVKRRIIRAAVVLVLVFAGFAGLYDADYHHARNIYWNEIEITDEANHARSVGERGFIYSFCYAINAYGFQEPENYGNYDFEELEKELAEASDGQAAKTDPHVIMVMCEAFSDITDGEAFNYSAADDPLANYHRLAASDRAISGHIVVPNTGAGTANTEFDVFTGVQTLLVAPGSNPFFSIRGSTDSVATVLKDAGYATYFTHPGRSWYYNRDSVYSYLGFDERVFIDDEVYDEAPRKDYLVTDEAVASVLTERFEEQLKSGDGPVFEFGVTIQNHMPYTGNRYGRTSGLTEELPLNCELSDESYEELSIYIEGVRDGDRMLGQLTQYFEKTEEPVILIFFGDHMPSLGEDFSCYEELGSGAGSTDTLENILLTYETPYIIWENKAAAEAGCIENPQKDYTISANYLGAMLLEAAGMADSDPYFSFLNKSRKTIQAVRDDVTLPAPLNGGKAQLMRLEDTSDVYRGLLEKMQCWGYYRMVK